MAIVFVVLVVNLKKIWEFYLYPNTQNMGAQFLSYTLDDPLSVSDNTAGDELYL